MDDLEVRLLDAPPSIAPLLARAVVTSRGRAGARGHLPQRRLMLRGVEQDVGRLAAYAEVTGGVLSDRLPATWLHVLTFPLQVELMAARDFPFPMVGMVHVANVMTQHRPVGVGEELTLSTWADHLAPHRKGSTVELHGEARVGEEVVWTGQSTYLVRGPSGEAGAGVVDEAGPGEERQAGRPGALVEVDAPPLPVTELATWRLPKDLGRRYARVSGDANPIHLTGVTAKALGFPRAIAHGMWTHARALAAVQPRLPAAFTLDAQFVKPVLLPSTVVLRGHLDQGGGALAVTSRDGAKVHMTMRVDAR
ncbi:MaoC/PaaZ C-terminal domain-containing protein [Ornithinimicrobium flavum]|uniref:MaoC/PaaZ C-terminal domain-containing protein n=1 Tax=Ornithinimicrobium flavum TaxID=1288636 RepID=UPI00106F821B|nr:MaoC/PaaZ C-terminal domain-containing protein [Ornithinimicrobium flavum]